MVRGLLAIGTIVLIGLGVPAAAAATRYVDDSGTDAANNCANPSAPCETINTAISVAAAGETIQIGGSFGDDDGDQSYASATVDEDVSLAEANFSPPATAGQAVIDGGAGDGINVIAAAGTIEGLTIRGDNLPLRISQPLDAVLDNVFDDPDLSGRPHIYVGIDGGSPTISGNVVSDSSPAPALSEAPGIDSDSDGFPVITQNTISGLGSGISADNLSGSPTGFVTITGNTISGISTNGGTSCGICVRGDVTANVIANHMHSPGAAGVINGISVITEEDNVINLSRNRVFGHYYGIIVLGDAAGSVTLDGDVSAKSEIANLRLSDQAPGGPEGDTTARNVTLVDSQGGVEIDLNGADLTLDSSIVGTDGITNPTGELCAITNSNLVPGGSPGGTASCAPGQFSLNLAPGFVDPGAANHY